MDLYASGAQRRVHLWAVDAKTAIGTIGGCELHDAHIMQRVWKLHCLRAAEQHFYITSAQQQIHRSVRTLTSHLTYDFNLQAAASKFQTVSGSSCFNHMPHPNGLKARDSSRRYQSPLRNPGTRCVRV